MFGPVNRAELLRIFHSTVCADFQKATRLLRLRARQSVVAILTIRKVRWKLRGEWFEEQRHIQSCKSGKGTIVFGGLNFLDGVIKLLQSCAIMRRDEAKVPARLAMIVQLLHHCRIFLEGNFRPDPNRRRG